MSAHARMLGHRALTGHGCRSRLAGLVTITVLLLTGAFAGPAQATTNVTADNSTVSQATGARTVYKIGFTAPQLTGGQQIQVTFNNGGDLSQIFSSVTDSTTARWSGGPAAGPLRGPPRR
jgi:hypothetical protein